MGRDAAAQALDIFDAVAELPPPERASRLEALCGSDLTLRAEVESLLIHDDPEWRGLERPALHEWMSAGAGEGQPPALPMKFGRYLLIERIGEGGMGVVYRAEQAHPRRQVALKLMRPGAGSASQAARFAREVEILAQLKHPGIAQIHDAGSVETPAGPQPYIAMELVEGRPLLQYADQARLNITQRLELWSAICEAVEHAHQRGVIHRDLKPENILMAENCEMGIANCELQCNASGHLPEHANGNRPFANPKVLDFGVARLADGRSASATIATAPGQVIGTPNYMAPEQFEGDADTRSDVYALGVLGHQLLTGRVPIDAQGEPIWRAARTIRETTPPPLSQFDRRLRGELELIVGKALEKDRQRRYASAAALAEDLRRFLRNEPIQARKASVGYLLGKLVRRHRAAAAVLAVLAILTVAYGATVTLLYRRSVRAESVASAYALDASRNFNIALDALQSIISEVDQELRHIAGATEIRERLLHRAVERFESLAREVPQDASLKAELARALTRLSDVAVRAGDISRAEQLRSEALAIWKELATAQPGNSQHRESLAIATVLVGDIHRHWGDESAAEALYLEAHEELPRLAAALPDDRHYRELLAYSLERIGNMAARRWDCAFSMSCAVERLKIMKELAACEPSNLMYQYGLCSCHIQMVAYLLRDGQPWQAFDHVRRAAEISERIIAAAPYNDQFADQYIRAQLSCPALDFGLDAVDECTARAEKARDYAARLVAAEPDNLMYQGLLNRCLGEQSRMAMVRGNSAEALELLEMRLGLLDRMFDSGASGVELQDNVCYSIRDAFRTFEELSLPPGREGLLVMAMSQLSRVPANHPICCEVLSSWAGLVAE